MSSAAPTNPRIKNELGNKYGKLMVVEFAGSENNQAMWKCMCDCGNEVTVSGKKLRQGNTKACGCLAYNNLMGKVFGRLTVVGYTEKRVRGNIVWQCACECGRMKLVEGAKLTVGAVKSCGCLQRDVHWKGYNDLSLSYFNSLRNRAKYKNIPFNITIEEVWDLFIQQKEKCALSGLPISFGVNNTASLDRINSSLGYTIDNIQWVYKNINVMKQNFEQNAFIMMCKLVANNNNNVLYPINDDSYEWLANCREVREENMVHNSLTIH